MISTAFEAISQVLKFNLCATEGVVRATARCLELLSELNGQVLRAVFDEHSAIAAQVRSPAEVTMLQIGLLGAAPQQAMSYWRHVGTIAVETCSDIAMDSRHCLSESSPQMHEFVDSLLSGAFLQKLWSAGDAMRRKGPRIVLADETDGTMGMPLS
ncbi:phasin family protein [Paraburkholderia hospita]|uniref:phasin family protein n=1 Tax=Paraburkholderia hospita TaxID=169430 RepID=UPI000B342259|nr:phasin family protein [Paraburkholderia hospita]OUL80456.1 hypothetical protein CA603_31885 [Paraburkholderia hospita]OUL86287.1 hypothetical protein CA601_22335 [Paraburkholderia hospita]